MSGPTAEDSACAAAQVIKTQNSRKYRVMTGLRADRFWKVYPARHCQRRTNIRREGSTPLLPDRVAWLTAADRISSAARGTVKWTPKHLLLER